MTRRIITLLSFLLIAPYITVAQKGITTFGIQYKPIIPNTIIGTYNQEFNADNFESSIQQKLGHSFGMTIRRGLTNIISIETGLIFTKRNFGLNFAVPDSGYSAVNKVGIISYEIPVQGSVYTRLSESFYMNTAFGVCLNYFPSDVHVYSTIKGNQYFLQEGARLNRIQGSILANIGFEYRTRNFGYFYIGGAYNLPFSEIITFAMSYEYPPGKSLAIDNVRGSYLTLDLRYYFNEKAETKPNTKK